MKYTQSYVAEILVNQFNHIKTIFMRTKRINLKQNCKKKKQESALQRLAWGDLHAFIQICLKKNRISFLKKYTKCIKIGNENL